MTRKCEKWREAFRSKLFTPAVTLFCDRNTGKRVNEQDLTGHSEGFGWTPIYHRWIQMCFRMQVGWYEALQQMLVPRLRRQSSHYLTSPLDQRCHMLSSLFHNACPVCQITLGAGRHRKTAIVADVVVMGDTMSVLHNHRHSCPISSQKNILLSCKLFIWKKKHPMCKSVSYEWGKKNFISSDKHRQYWTRLAFCFRCFPLVLTRGIKRCTFDYMPQGKHAETSEAWEIQ